MIFSVFPMAAISSGGGAESASSPRNLRNLNQKKTKSSVCGSLEMDVQKSTGKADLGTEFR